MNQELGLHLSANKSNHVYCQTHKKGLVHIFRMLKESGKTHYNMESKESVTGAPCKWAELLSQDCVWLFMEPMEPMDICMFDVKLDMNIHRFHATLQGG